MKKILAYLLAAVLVLGCLTGCKKEEPSDNDNQVTETQAPADDTTKQAGTDTDTASGSDLTAAKDYLFAMYKDKQGTTASDFERVAVLNIDGNAYTVSWSVDNANAATVVAGDKFATIDVNETSADAQTYVLTATITDASGNSVTQAFNHDVPAYKEATWADYAAAAVDDTVICTGIVTGIMSKTNGNSNNCLYFQDNDGGYYAYNLGDDPVADLGIAVGMTVKVTGQKDVYSGTMEIKNCSVEIVDSSIKSVTPVDYTDKYLAADNLKNADLVEKQALLVTVKGVEIGSVGDNGYYYFKLGELQSYVRISSSVCPIVAEKDTFISEFENHQGWTADATGVLCVYDGAFYLTPVTTDAYQYISLPVKSEAEMVAFEAEKIAFAGTYNTETTIELPAAGSSYTDVQIAWATSDETVAAIADGICTITLPANDTAIVLTATLTAGAETLVQEYAFTVEAPADDMCEAEILAKAFALEDGASLNGKQVLKGVITEIPTEYSADYDNVTVNIEVAGQTIQCFRLAGGSELVVGDEIVVTGILKNYKGTVEFDAKCTYSKDLTVDEAKQLVVCEKAFALEEGAALNGTQVLRGEIVEIPTEYSAEYDNVTVNIGVGEYVIQCFRLVGGSELAVGDVITVTGTLKNYKGTIEFDSKCTYSKDQTLAEAKQLVTCAKAFALEEGAAMNGMQVLTGTIVEIPTEYSADYDNVTVNIQVGDYTVQCFRLAGGSDLAVGDVITVTGTLKNYKGTVEFDAKCTYVK